MRAFFSYVAISAAFNFKEVKRLSPFGGRTLYNVAATLRKFSTTKLEDLSHRLSTTPDELAQVFSPDHEVVIALGSNVGDRMYNFNQALKRLNDSGIRIIRHGCLYESEPAYVVDQPHFLNSAVRGLTKLPPHQLLKTLKQIEKDLGRTDGVRYGPRPIDLDILFYDKYKVASDILTIPHERIWERPFVVAPLIDLLGSSIENDVVASWHSLAKDGVGLFKVWHDLGGASLIGSNGLRRVLPLGNQLLDLTNRTYIMGVINLTPDSFSDGGKYQSLEAALAHVRLLISEGADIIDIGAQSTRPSAARISAEEELDRLIPVLEAVVKMPEFQGKLLSVDTFHSKVAYEAVGKGVHIVNDVSGGRLDSNMYKVVADLGVPYVIMHMRGDPKTMQNSECTLYHNVCKEVALELYARFSDAELSGIAAWRIILDPGIGFSKTTVHNLQILANLPRLRKEIEVASYAASHAPLLIGPSRKRFLGEICNHPDAVERDAATIAAVSAGIFGGANIIRVHNVKDNLDASRVCDSLIKKKKDQSCN